MRFNKNKATRCLVISSAILATQGCGNASSTNVPKSVKDLTTTDITDAGVIARQAKWDEMATALGIGNNKAETSAELLTQLGSPSTYLTDATRATEFATLVGTLAAKYALTSGGARCHSVTSVTYIDEAKDSADASVAAKVYMMKFKTYSDATFAAADDVEHAAYLTIPTAASANPILTYGHGGDSGIGYTEIKKNIGALQAATIVVAPPSQVKAFVRSVRVPRPRPVTRAAVILIQRAPQCPMTMMPTNFSPPITAWLKWQTGSSPASLLVTALE